LEAGNVTNEVKVCYPVLFILIETPSLIRW
jgi:hypothetical protein